MDDDRIVTPEFVKNAAHIFRTPLSTINWNAELLEEEQLSEKGKQYLHEIQLATLKATALANSFISALRLESGVFTVNRDEVDIEASIQEVIKSLQPLLKEKNINVEYKNTVKETLKLDIRIIKNILTVLVDNAIRYSKEGGSVHVLSDLKEKGDTVGEHAVNHTSLSLVVVDTGIGIPAAEKELVFRQFQRAENALAVETSGAGLGLFIAKKFAQLVAGEMWFESEEGKGSTFHCLVPITKI